MLYVVKNAEEINTGEMKPEEIGVKAIDDKTLRGHAQRADPVFPGDADASGDLSGAPRRRSRSSAPTGIKPGNLVSNGAFTLAEFVPNDHIKIVKNPKFHDAGERRRSTS